ncbi:hypothetical protein SD427_03385 [Chryseobacterium sp. JJR-5R]|uniref:hypothetical protein n=1 Tax=Chryseobacterium sp. JJR-5R TaxID=3093923 RepID=UPI002A764B3C|nr:hypothetical protein [Chryseobacterium sp. JJR-5R]WPO83397.1 hypothetical protein SD427_03385 [Chryseobacterium sp. JJR-5R]
MNSNTLVKAGLLALLFTAFSKINAQFPGTSIVPLKEMKMRNVFGGTSYDGMASVTQTSDGGYITAGDARSSNGDVTINQGGNSDFWVTKYDKRGRLIWQKTYGGTGDDTARSIIQTADGGYAVAGDSSSNNGNASGNHGSSDMWIIKISSSGALQWQRSLGGSNLDNAFSIVQSTDGGYAVAGRTESNDGNVSGYHGGVDLWVVKLSSTGTLQWQKTFGGTDGEVANSIITTADGGYTIAGYTRSNDGDASGNHGLNDFWIIKINSAGTLQWQRTYGGTNAEIANSLFATVDGGYALAGYTRSNNGDVSGNHGNIDIWVIKISNTGVLQWQKTFGGIGNDQAESIIQTTDGGYAVAGTTSSIDGDISGNHGSQDGWIIKISSSGILEWQKALGGTDTDSAYSIIQSANSTYVVAGGSSSTDGDIVGPANGLTDAFILNLDTNGNIVRFYDDVTL